MRRLIVFLIAAVVGFAIAACTVATPLGGTLTYKPPRALAERLDTEEPANGQPAAPPK
jgi:uncharacterized membrane protein YdfJ with MMPL/SSD domain